MNIKKLFKSHNGEIKMNLIVDPRLENLFKIDINNEIQMWLVKASLLTQNKSKDIAPYLSWTLKRSISVDYSWLSQLYTIVWSSLPYARIRHFINNKNPQTLRYLWRWYEDSKQEIDWIFKKIMDKILKW
jgi:hypothetical protein